MTTARRIALLIIAALFGYGMAPEPQPAAKAAPVVVGSPPGELARLTSLAADLQATCDRDRATILKLETEIAVAKSKCLNESSPCANCQCPGDGRCAKGECQAAQPAAEAKRVVYQYQPPPRRGLFGRRR